MKQESIVELVFVVARQRRGWICVSLVNYLQRVRLRLLVHFGVDVTFAKIPTIQI